MSTSDVRPKAPKTPLKRISRNSLRAQALSASQIKVTNSNPTKEEEEEEETDVSKNKKDPLKSISPLLLELSESIQDFQTNLMTLDQVCSNLNGFNGSFSSYLYGLRMNFYTTDFDEGPDEIGLDFFKSKRKEEEEVKKTEGRLKAVEDEEKKVMELDHDRFQDVSGYDQADQSSTSRPTQIRNQENSKAHHPIQSTSNITSGIERNLTSKPLKSFKSQTKANQKTLLKSTESIMKSLPIKFREQQPSRSEMEKVICLLILNPNGLLIKQIVKLDSTLALHRARECVTALVAAKQATKLNQDGLVYRLN